jgi:pyruvate dehydrogenase E1 component alpha subunit
MPVTEKQMIDMYTLMVRSYKMDELLIRAQVDGKTVSSFHSLRGLEATHIGATMPLRRDDFLSPTLRGHGTSYVLAKGGEMKPLIAGEFGRATGLSHGLAGDHPSYPEIGILGGSATIGSQFPIALGWGLAAKKNGRGQVVAGFFGDGTSNRGTLHEAFLMTANWKLPIVWICENNGYAINMPIKDAYPKEDIADLAFGYGMPGTVVDGQDVVAVYEVVEAAVARARAGEGPSLIEAKTYHFRPHSEGQIDMRHAIPRPKEEKEAWFKRDPIKLFEDKLLKQGILTQGDIKRIDQEATAEAQEAERFALESPWAEVESPWNDPSTLEKSIYAESKGGKL